MITEEQSRIYSQMQILNYQHNEHFSYYDIIKIPHKAEQRDLFRSRKGFLFFLDSAQNELTLLQTSELYPEQEQEKIPQQCNWQR